MRALPWFLLSLAVVILDHIAKWLASATLSYGVPVELLPVLDLTLLHNRGAAFSFLSDAGGWQRWFFVLVSLAVSVALVFWLRRLGPGQRLLALALALVLGGALGNLIDRLWLGHVIDFIQLYYSDFYWPAFNVADSAITAGAVLLVWDALFGGREKA
jgi:signal peptidase II